MKKQMKKKVNKNPKIMTFMVTNLVTVSGCSLKKAKMIAEEVTNSYDCSRLECYNIKGIDYTIDLETIIPVKVKA